MPSVKHVRWADPLCNYRSILNDQDSFPSSKPVKQSSTSAKARASINGTPVNRPGINPPIRQRGTELNNKDREEQSSKALERSSASAKAQASIEDTSVNRRFIQPPVRRRTTELNNKDRREESTTRKTQILVSGIRITLSARARLSTSK